MLVARRVVQRVHQDPRDAPELLVGLVEEAQVVVAEQHDEVLPRVRVVETVESAERTAVSLGSRYSCQFVRICRRSR